MRFAPRLDPRVLAAVRRLDDRLVPIAETCRRVGEAAAELGLARPSYAHLRRVILVEREHADARRELAEEIASPLALGRLPDAYRLEQRHLARRRRA